jgi:hypothetical protein
MAIYNLDDISFLSHDIEKALKKINSLYKVTYNPIGNTYLPKRVADGTNHWASTETQEVFNKIIPEVKSLHKDMYAIIESISKVKKGQFKKDDLEKRFDNFKEFRLLNNKFKHFNSHQTDITLAQIVVIGEGEQHLIDIYVNFKYPDTLRPYRYSEFIETFMRILIELGAIKIE